MRREKFAVFESKDILCSNQKISCVRITRFLVFESKVVLCSNQDISRVPTKTFPSSQGGHVVVPKEDMCWWTVRDWMGWNFGRTDLRIRASKAKFDARADGAVRLAVRRPKPRKIREKNFLIREFRETVVSLRIFFCNFCDCRNCCLEIFPPTM